LLSTSITISKGAMVMNRGTYLSDTAGAIAGLAFSVLLLAAFWSVDPLREASDAELVAWWTDAANLRNTVLSSYFMLACVPCFLLFLVTLRGRLEIAEGQPASGSAFVFSAGLCFAAAVLIGGVARGVIAQSVKLGDEPLPGPDMLRYMTAFSMATFALVAMPAAAIAVAAASWLIVRLQAMAVWLGWAGAAAAGVVAVATPFLMAPFAAPLIMLWVVAASVELWRTREAVAERTSEVRMARTGDAMP
jgi:hypothetical protein